MRLLPVVERELRISARKSRLYWGRFTAAAAAMVVVLWIWISFGGGTSEVKARQIFGSLSVMAFIYSILAGVWLTADAISEEKREGTLGLLFLTDLKGYDVILGKVFATSLNAFYGLMAVFPVMAIPLLLGGLTSGDFWRMVLVLVETLLFSVGLGILVSSFSRYERKAQLGAFGLIVLISGVLPLIAAMRSQPRRALDLRLLYPSPGYAFSLSYEQIYNLSYQEFWISIGTITAIWGAAILGAGLIVPRTWQDRPELAFRFRWQRTLDRLRNGSLAGRLRYRQALLQVNPFYWLGARDRLKRRYVHGLLAAGAAAWAYFYFRYRSDMRDPVACFATGLVLHTLLKLWVASEGGRMLAEDRKSGALELTLSTPVQVREILEGNFLALMRQFGWAAALIVLADLGLMLLGRYNMGSNEPTEWLLMCLAGIIVFVSDLIVLSMVAMWLGLTSRKPGRAFGKTIFFVLLLPWLVFFALIAIIAYGGKEPESKAILGIWFAISLAVDALLFSWASLNLRTRFREVATSRFDQKPA
jgi:ABC-type transport system involved in multi-copper enzyme maturation permease subunit